MVEIGGQPMLWHIMKMYSAQGVDDFIVCCGYRGYVIKEYFANFPLHMSDITLDLEQNTVHVRKGRAELWRITLIDTGEGTLTGGRPKRVADYVEGEDAFCMAYGDDLSDIDISATITFRRKHGRLATVTGVKSPGGFGALELGGQRVAGFMEKPKEDEGLVNGCFFVLNLRCLDQIDGVDTRWEDEPLTRLAAENQLRDYEHHGY